MEQFIVQICLKSRTYLFLILKTIEKILMFNVSIAILDTLLNYNIYGFTIDFGMIINTGLYGIITFLFLIDFFDRHWRLHYKKGNKKLNKAKNKSNQGVSQGSNTNIQKKMDFNKSTETKKQLENHSDNAESNILEQKDIFETDGRFYNLYIFSNQIYINI